MKVIFLDVDGVLNDALTEDLSPGGFIGIEDAKVRNLAAIVERTGAKIVLTSTWKDEWHLDSSKNAPDGNYLNECLAKRGLSIMDKTNDFTWNRGAGISDWLQAHPDVQSWIVLDDTIYDDFECHNIMPHLVRTYFGHCGLTEAHVNQAVHMLN